MRCSTQAARSEAGAGLDGMLDSAGYVGRKVEKDGFDIGKIKRARDILPAHLG
jgi:hypothetical protein